MGMTYWLHVAKARLSEVIRRVRAGTTVTVSSRGELVGEIRALTSEQETIEDRFEALERKGIIAPALEGERRFHRLAERPGALERFLADRGE